VPAYASGSPLIYGGGYSDASGRHLRKTERQVTAVTSLLASCGQFFRSVVVLQLWIMRMKTAIRSTILFLGFGVVIATASALRPQDQPVDSAPSKDPMDTRKPAQSVPPVQPPASQTPPAPGESKSSQPPAAVAKADPYVLAHKVLDIDGKEVKLEDYKGKVILIVNVASQCGFTRQYVGLEAMYLKYKDRGFEVLGFPSNDFGNQEPGTDAEIKAFCSAKYKVTFPMFGKVPVLGANAHPLFKQLAGQPGSAGGEPKWNFNKYLVGRDGKVIEHFESGAKPDGDLLTKKVEAALSVPKP